MIRVAAYVARTDTGRQRATNEDSHLARSPIFAVADGMGGAQAGEVASQLAIAHFAADLPGDDHDQARDRLVRAAQDANAEIHELSESDARRAGMGTTLTAAYVADGEVVVAHVGDSRAYRWRDGALERITEDHSLVEELMRQGRLTEEEAEEHPQRSIITRALGPEPEVEIDTFAVDAQDGDVYLLCSDGLTSMVSETVIATVLDRNVDLAAAADELVEEALDAGGRDNVTVVLFGVEDVGADMPTQALAPVVGDEAAVDRSDEPATASQDAPTPAAVPPPTAPANGVGAIPARRSPREPRRRAPRAPRVQAVRRRHPWRRRLGITTAILAVLAVIAIGGLLATQSVYFIGTNPEGQVTVFNGVPYVLPGGIRLYTQFFVSGVTVAELSTLERTRLFNNELRSQDQATRLVNQLELGKIAGQ